MVSRRLAVWCFVGMFTLTAVGCGGCGSSSKKKTKGFDEQVKTAMEDSDPASRAKKLAGIAVQRFNSGDQPGANNTIGKAVEACEEIEDAAGRAEVFAQLAEGKNQIGEPNGAKELAEKATKAVKEIDEAESAERKGIVLAKVGRAYGVIGNPSDARSTLKEAVELADGMSDPMGKLLVLTEVAGSFYQFEATSDYNRIMGTIRSFVESMPDARNRADALAAVAAQQAALKISDASATFDDAEGEAGKIEDPASGAHALINIAEKLSKASRHTRAHEVLKKADTIANTIKAPDVNKQTVEKVRTLMQTLPKPKKK